MARAYRLISSDGHLELPPERWGQRVVEQCQDPAPRTMHLPDGGDALFSEVPATPGSEFSGSAGQPAGRALRLQRY
jgi:hypothetical protein